MPDRAEETPTVAKKSVEEVLKARVHDAEFEQARGDLVRQLDEAAYKLFQLAESHTFYTAFNRSPAGCRGAAAAVSTYSQLVRLLRVIRPPQLSDIRAAPPAPHPPSERATDGALDAAPPKEDK